MSYKYALISAYAQCGTAPPFNCLSIPVRMEQAMPQIKIDGEWVDCPKDGPRPKLERYYGMPVAGISTEWRLAPPGELS